MMRLIHDDVRIALAAEANLEAANDIVRATPDHHRPGANAYNSVHQCISLNLAISLARLFDEGSTKRHPNLRDVASIPLMVRLLRQMRCRRVLVERAREWTPMMPGLADLHEAGCTKALNDAVAAYEVFAKSPEGRRILARLRDFRNRRLAHSLMVETLGTLPRYNDLFHLMDVARDVSDAAQLAIDGIAPDLPEHEQIVRRDADIFWRSAFNYEPDEEPSSGEESP
jgi:hypothetical protein